MRDMRQTLQGWNGNVEGKKKLKRDLLEEIDKLDRLSELNGLTALDIEKKIQYQQQLRILNK
jgi:hypothetical protein